MPFQTGYKLFADQLKKKRPQLFQQAMREMVTMELENSDPAALARGK